MNPFSEHISDEQFEYIIKQGFRKSNLDCYAHLDGNLCYKKYLTSSIGWDVNIYITENGIAVDHNYDCGGNSSNFVWWFKDGKYTRKEYEIFSDVEKDVEYIKISHSFEDAWNEMIELSTNL